MDPTEIFDRQALRLRRDRATRIAGGDALRRHIAGELVERLAAVRRSFGDILCLSDAAGTLATHFRQSGARVIVAEPGRTAADVQCDFDRLPFADGSFDLVVSAGGLELVNDLPGALSLIRRILRPDGLLLAGFVGAGSLPRLRAAMLAADLVAGAASPRIHPQIDVRAGGDLLARAGLALPVADGETLAVRYADLAGLVADLRRAGATNLLRSRGRPLTRRQYAAASAAFAETADADGRVTEQLALVYLSGWAPSPDQPRPAQRGSGTSLATVLPPR